MGLLDFLKTRSIQEAKPLENQVRSELAELFPEPDWGIDIGIHPYTESNYSNIWRNELRSKIKMTLVEKGLAEQGYKEWLGDIQFINIAVFYRKLFEKYRSNVGWRLTIFSLPPAEIIICGIASHYQNAQNHSQLGKASGLLFQIANQGLSDLSNGDGLLGRKVSQDDWDQRGLFPKAVTRIASIDVSEADPNGLMLKDIRITTVKKIVASFISVKPVTDGHDQDLLTSLENMRNAAEKLYLNVYPFRSLDEFEHFRALAYQDY